MRPDLSQVRYDLFISYAHADNRGDSLERMTALVASIKAD
jgi:hypothetical protein